MLPRPLPCPPLLAAPPDIICNANQYRIGSRPGTCHTCSNIGCQTGAFRRGACGGATNGYACNTCANAQCAATEYRSGSCSGTHNGYACNTCANLQCGANQYRHGSCSLTSNGYSCRTCTNMVCGTLELFNTKLSVPTFMFVGVRPSTLVHEE